MNTRFHPGHHPALLAMVALAALAMHRDVHALTFLVGSDGQCDYGTVQAAINGAASSPGPDSIHIANNLSYTQQTLTIGSQDLIIEGGYASCGSATPSGNTILNGAGGSAESVLRISGSGVRDLANLIIRGGDPSVSSNGGGIRFSGSGDLILRNVGISNNAAGNGGGIYFNGSGGNAILTLETNTVVLNNTAQYSGGGIHVSGSARLFMLRDRTTVQGNTALGIGEGGNGGGIVVEAPAMADIASPGYLNAGAIYNNTAPRGGGLAVVSNSSGQARVRLFSVTAGKPVRLHGNHAGERGGAIWVQSWSGDFSTHHWAAVCAYDVLIDGNTASLGAAAYADSRSDFLGFTTSSYVQVNAASCPLGFPENMPSLGRVPCTTGANNCNFIANNRAADSNGVETGGALVQLGDDGRVELRNAVLIGNTAGNIVRGSDGSVAEINNSLVVGNSLSSDILQFNGADVTYVTLTDNTFAGNVIGGATHLIRFDEAEHLTMHNNILWQPGKLTLLYPGGGQNLSAGDISYNIVSDVSTLPQGPLNQQSDPQFIDPGAVNFGLRIHSPALDFSPPVDGNDAGIDGRPRDQQVRPGAPRALLRDAGALERQPPDPYLINGTFEGGLRGWTSSFPQYTQWAAFDDGPGGASGSSQMLIPGDQTGTPGGIQVVSINGLTQCFTVPWPGTYKLTARGFTKPDNSYLFPDNAVVNWKLRYHSPDCTGPVNAEGDLVLPNAVGWNSPLLPAFIPIALSDWNYQTTLEINLVALQNLSDPALQNPLYARVDNVVLEYLGVGPLFRDGFENADL